MDFDYYDEINRDVPELLPGDVIKASTDNNCKLSYWLVQQNGNLLGFCARASDGTEAVLCDTWHVNPLKHQAEILKVYRQNGGYNHRELAMIVSDEFAPTIYSKKDVKELTVDEVSKLLGYKVKIVGDQK